MKYNDVSLSKELEEIKQLLENLVEDVKYLKKKAREIEDKEVKSRNSKTI
jgi:hypothetical protein